MKKIFLKIGSKIKQGIDVVKSKFIQWFAKDTQAGGSVSPRRHMPYAPADKSRGPQKATVVKPFTARASRPRRRQPSKQHVMFANKQRFFSVIGMVTAAVLVPVLVVSAAGLPEADAAETNAPAAQVEPAAVEVTELGVPEADAAEDAQATPEVAGDVAATLPETEANATEADTADAPAEETEAEAATETQEESSDRQLILIPESRSSEVIKLQQRLMDLHYMDADEPTEYYGAQTQQAVKYFQRKHGLAMDGAAGEETQKLLFSDDAKTYSVALEAEGLDVENIQQRLEQLDYPVDDVEGYFGDGTESAVQYFQRMNGLEPDGSVGQNTRDILFSESAEPAIPQPKDEPEGEEGSSSDSDADGGGSGESSDGGSSSSSDDDEGSSGSSGESSSSSSDDEDEEESSGGGGGGSAPSANPGSVEAFVNAALAQEGKPYVLGGKGPDVFDCSGLVYYALNASGNSVGYMTSGGWAGSSYPTIGSVDALERGDVICMSGHVGIYLGGGSMVDASSSNGRIVVRSLGSWARSNFICGKRPL